MNDELHPDELSDPISGQEVVCENGHVYILKDFTPPKAAIACISWCQSEVPHPPAGLIYECGARVVWRRHEPLDRTKKPIRFGHDKQLDLFFDQEGVDKVKE